MEYLALPIGDSAPQIVNAVIEIPRDEVNKYEYDKRLQVFRLDRNLHSPVHYPGDYGFVPSTEAEDGDPLDVVVLVDAPSFPGCLMEVRPIGLLEMVDQGIADQKIICVPLKNPRYTEVESYEQIAPHLRRELEHFFSIYKELEGKKTAAMGWQDREAAYRAVLESHQRYRKK